jgi:hypothetical protein
MGARNRKLETGEKEMENTNANATTTTATATITPEQLEMLGLTQEMYNALPEATRIVLLKGLKPARTPKARQPKDIWSNSSLLIDGNDHARLLVTLAVMTRDGTKEQDITQCDWVRHCMALSIALGAYKATATQGIAEASTRTAAGQLRRAREVLDITKLQDKVKAVQFQDFERAMYDHYKDRDLFGGAKEDSDKRWSRQRCELLRANWRDNWTADNDWRPTDDGTLPLFVDDTEEEDESGVQ